MFKKAEKKQAKLRLALTGTSGSGKTTGALMIAKGLGGRIAVLDTERGSASLYSDQYDFDVVELDPPYTPERYIEVIHAAEKEGYTTLILDSITHEWSGQGGILEIVDNYARTKMRGNSYMAWSEGTPRHQAFLDAMLASKCHIIATMRSKAVYVESEKSNGKKAIEKQGSAPQQRDGLEYEFTCVLDINLDRHLTTASKDRTRLFNDPFVISEETGVRLREWLENGVEAVEHTPVAAPKTDSKPRKKQAEASTQEEAVKGSSDLLASQEQAMEIARLLRRSGPRSAADLVSSTSEFVGRSIQRLSEISSAEAEAFIAFLTSDAASERADAPADDPF